MQQLVSKLWKTVNDLQTKVIIAENDIILWRNEVTDLKTSVSAKERYPSKDCIIFHNFLFQVLSQNMEADVFLAINFFFEFEVTPAAFKSCRPLCKKVINGGKVAPVNVKFVYFRDKNEIFVRRKTFLESKKSGNHFKTERLPLAQLDLRKTFEEQNLLTTTHPLSVQSKCSCKTQKEKLLVRRWNQHYLPSS